MGLQARKGDLVRTRLGHDSYEVTDRYLGYRRNQEVARIDKRRWEDRLQALAQSSNVETDE